MEAVLKLQQALSNNYYQSFLVSIKAEIDTDFYLYNELVTYKEEEYIELHLKSIKKESKKIINSIKPIYYEAISEIYLKLANLNNSIEKINYLSNILKLFYLIASQLQKDILIDNEESKYHSKINYNTNVISFNIILNEFMNMTIHKKFDDKRNTNFQLNYEPSDLYYLYFRAKYIGFLPTALFTVTSSFINILQNNLDKITLENTKNFFNEEEISKLNWNSKPAHLGYIVGVLADLDYIDAPKRQNGDINYTQFAKEVLQTFKLKKGTEATLTKYLNTTTEKAQETERNFKSASFNIPHKKEVS